MRENMKQKYPLLHKTVEILSAGADRVAMLARKVEALPGKIPEIFAFLVYAAAHLGMAAVHEPFFDEAEAWQIARSVTLKPLFLETPHYEGHPPLWHLILMPLAKAGAPYELSLSLVSLAFMGTAVFLILWRAPFPRLVRLLLPFTYFFFYQYGVISRVYCVLTLAFVLLAIVYRSRNERPGRYVAALILMCVTLAYGLVIAGGLALVWLWEIGNAGSRKQDVRVNRGKYGSRNGQGGRFPDGLQIREWLRGCAADRRIRWLAVLLAAALGVIWQIMPRPDTYAVVSGDSEIIRNSFAVRLLYTLLVLPADAVATDIYSEHMILPRAFLMPSAMVGGVVTGLLVWGLLLYYGRKKGTVLLLVLPYSLFAVFSALVYMSIHHIGIGLLYFVFWCWVSAESGNHGVCPAGTRDGENARRMPGSVETAAGRVADRLEMSAGISAADAVRCTAVLFGTLAMSVSLYWTGAACRLDMDKEYAPGRNEAAFIKEHHLDRYWIMSGWLVEHDAEGNVRNVDINECNMAVNLAPYFEDNLYFNFNGGKNDRNYITHIRLSEDETQRQFAQWRKQEPPQVLWMMPDLSAAYGGAVSMRDYVLVYQGDAEQVWKAGADYLASSIHVRRDLLEETGLSPLQTGR